MNCKIINNTSVGIKAIISTAALMAVAAVCSCDRQPDISGTWEGSPAALPDAANVQSGQNITSQIRTTLTFIPSQDAKDSGTVEFLSYLDVISTTPFDSTAVAPYEVSMAATATATGTYRFTDDDDIAVSINQNSVSVNVDPNRIEYAENLMTGAQAPSIKEMSPRLAAVAKAKLTPAVRLYFSQFQALTDIEVQNGTLTFEVNDTDYTFTSSGN